MKLEGEVRIPSGCAVAAVIDRDGGRIPGNLTAEAMRPTSLAVFTMFSRDSLMT